MQINSEREIRRRKNHKWSILNIYIYIYINYYNYDIKKSICVIILCSEKVTYRVCLGSVYFAEIENFLLKVL